MMVALMEDEPRELVGWEMRGGGVPDCTVRLSLLSDWHSAWWRASASQGIKSPLFTFILAGFSLELMCYLELFMTFGVTGANKGNGG